jgi:HK97 family phage portal protein
MPSVFQRLSRIFRASPPAPRQGQPLINAGFLNRFGFGFAPVANTTGVAVNERTALALPAFLCGVNCIASDLSALPLELVQVMSDGTVRPAKEHPAWPIFSRSPDGQTTSQRWRSAILAHSIVYGGGFSEIVPAVDGSRVYLFLLDPAATSVQIDPGGGVRYVTAGGTLPPESVVHVAGLSFDGLTGSPLVRLARQALGLGLAAEQFAGSFLGSSASPAGWFKSPNNLKPEAKREFLDSVEERHAGPESAGKAGILPPGWDWLEVKSSANPASAELMELRRFSVLEVARLLRLPPHKLGDYSNASYSSIEAANIEYQANLRPWAEAFEQALNWRLLTDEEAAAGFQFRHDFSALLRTDTAARTARNSAMMAWGCLQPDEWRISEGFEPLNTDRSRSTYTPLNMTPAPTPVPESGKLEPKNAK